MGGRSYHQHFTDEKTEAQRHSHKISQLAKGRARTWARVCPILSSSCSHCFMCWVWCMHACDSDEVHLCSPPSTAHPHAGPCCSLEVPMVWILPDGPIALSRPRPWPGPLLSGPLGWWMPESDICVLVSVWELEGVVDCSSHPACFSIGWSVLPPPCCSESLPTSTVICPHPPSGQRQMGPCLIPPVCCNQIFRVFWFFFFLDKS